MNQTLVVRVGCTPSLVTQIVQIFYNGAPNISNLIMVTLFLKVFHLLLSEILLIITGEKIFEVRLHNKYFPVTSTMHLRKYSL